LPCKFIYLAWRLCGRILSTRARSSRSRVPARACGPGIAWPWVGPDRPISCCKEGRAGMGGVEFALRVICELCRDYSRRERGFTNDKDHTRSFKWEISIN
jgi:hypothetical protein